MCRGAQKPWSHGALQGGQVSGLGVAAHEGTNPNGGGVGVDVREEKLAISGWTEQTEIDLFGFLGEMTGAGVRQVFCTDIGKDGLMTGPSVNLYHKVLQLFPGLELIASGGVRSPEDLTGLEDIGCTGAIVGKAIYEDVDNLKIWLHATT